MRVSRRSWHMRLCQFAYGMGGVYVPKNLCHHFWSVVGIPIFGVFVLMVGIVVIVLSPIWLSIIWVMDRRERKASSVKEPGLVTAWFKAKKQRVCPLIELVD